MNLDRRRSYRVALRPGQGTLETASGNTAEISSLSVGGLGLIIRERHADEVGGGFSRVYLGAESFRARLEPLYRVTKTPGSLASAGATAAGLAPAGLVAPASLGMGARFLSIDEDALRIVARNLVQGAVEESRQLSRLGIGTQAALVCKDQSFIDGLFQHLAMTKGRRLRVYAEGLLLDDEYRLTDNSQSDRLRMETVKGQPSHLELGCLYTFVMASGAAVYYFEGCCLSVNQHEVEVQRPKELGQTGFRDSMRTQTNGETGLRVSFKHPLFPSRVIDKPVVDVAGRGLSFEVNLDDDLLVPGTRIQELKIRMPSGPCRSSGIVRYIGQKNGAIHLCGVEMTMFAGAVDADRWHDFVFHTQYPNINLAEENACNIAWNILKASDYVQLWTKRSDRPYLAKKFGEAWIRMPKQFGHVLVLRDDIRPIGTVSANLLYPRTWIIHHFGVAKEERTPKQKKDFLRYTREVYSAVMYMIQYFASAEYFVLYVEQTKRWNDLMYGYFVDRYTSTTDFVYSQLDVYECQLASLAIETSDLSINVQVVDAKPEWMKLLANTLESKLSRLELQSFSYGTDELDLRGFFQLCRDHGYERLRVCYFAAVAGVPLVAAIVESGLEGVNVFGLVNTVRLIDLVDAHPQLQEARNDLMARVAQHYQTLGKRSFLWLRDQHTGDIGDMIQHFRHVSPAIRWVVRRDVVPAWLSYVDDLLEFQG